MTCLLEYLNLIVHSLQFSPLLSEIITKKFPQKGDNYIWFILQLNTIQENEIGLNVFKQCNCQYKLGKIFICVCALYTQKNFMIYKLNRTLRVWSE